MPCIKRLGAVKICVYLRDHNPPHFHLLHGSDEELIEIKNLQTMAGSISKAQRKKAVTWVEEYREYVIRRWNEFNADNQFME